MTEMKLLHIMAGLNGLLKKRVIWECLALSQSSKFNETHLEKDSKK